MNNLSISGLQILLSYILNLREQHSSTYQRVWFDTPLLRQPAWQSLQILPEAYADKLEAVADWMEEYIETPDKPFRGFKDYEVQRMRRNIAWMKEGTDNVEQKRADFYRFFSEHDRRRDTDFLQTFPEMRAFWQECESHARRS
jgi:tRNA-dihydrouridine synthase